jgi:O-antigen ligase
LFGLLTVGLTYGLTNPGDAVRYWAKYLDLLFVPIFVSLFRDEQTRSDAMKAFGGALIVTLVVSLPSSLGFLHGNPVLPSNDIEYPTGFKYSITHSLLVGFGAFAFALYARHSASLRSRLALCGLALLAIANVLFVVISRTGYLVLAALLLYFFVAEFRWRGLIAAAALGVVLLGVGFYSSATFQQRVNTAITELRAWQPDKPANTSVGLRMEFYRRSLNIVREHPLFGAGTGSFPTAYAATVKGKQIGETVNPHNEYLLIAAQVGLVGLACLLFLFYTQWRLAARLTPLYRDLARGLVIVFALGCLFNSLLLDHTEGLFFAWATGLCFASLKPPSTPSAA